jgi:hypothetical protein
VFIILHNFNMEKSLVIFNVKGILHWCSYVVPEETTSRCAEALVHLLSKEIVLIRIKFPSFLLRFPEDSLDTNGAVAVFKNHAKTQSSIAVNNLPLRRSDGYQ